MNFNSSSQLRFRGPQRRVATRGIWFPAVEWGIAEKGWWDPPEMGPKFSVISASGNWRSTIVFSELIHDLAPTRLIRAILPPARTTTTNIQVAPAVKTKIASDATCAMLHIQSGKITSIMCTISMTLKCDSVHTIYLQDTTLRTTLRIGTDDSAW